MRKSIVRGMDRMTRSVAIFVNVERVTARMLWTALQRDFWPGVPGGTMLQFEAMGEHQKAMRHMWRMKVARVKREAA